MTTFALRCLASLVLTALLVSGCGEPAPSNRIVVERHIAAIDNSIEDLTLLAISPHGKRLFYAALTGGQVFSVVDGKSGKRYDHLLLTHDQASRGDSGSVADTWIIYLGADAAHQRNGAGTTARLEHGWAGDDALALPMV